ncbi:hypothetical protein C8R45DRAFT_1069245 [Mycena sanguinolenta]|nr:hypothetical protein C8R45DRAFT_1069245 [Mycena sanguinolenta]
MANIETKNFWQYGQCVSHAQWLNQKKTSQRSLRLIVIQNMIVEDSQNGTEDHNNIRDFPSANGVRGSKRTKPTRWASTFPEKHEELRGLAQEYEWTKSKRSALRPRAIDGLPCLRKPRPAGCGIHETLRKIQIINTSTSQEPPRLQTYFSSHCAEINNTPVTASDCPGFGVVGENGKVSWQLRHLSILSAEDRRTRKAGFDIFKESGPVEKLQTAQDIAWEGNWQETTGSSGPEIK